MEPDPATFLPHIDQNPAALFSYQLQRDGKLLSAVAAQAAKNIAGSTFRMHSDQYRLASSHVAHYQGDVLGGIAVTFIGDSSELAVLGGQFGLRHPVHQFFMAGAVSN